MDESRRYKTEPLNEESLFAAPKSDQEAPALQVSTKTIRPAPTRIGRYFVMVGLLIAIDFLTCVIFTVVFIVGAIVSICLKGGIDLDDEVLPPPLPPLIEQSIWFIVFAIPVICYFIGGVIWLRFGYFRIYPLKQGWGYSLTTLMIHSLISGG